MNEDENSPLIFLTVSYWTLTLKKWRNQFKSVKKKLRVSWKSSRWHRAAQIHLAVWVDCRFGRKLNAKWAQWSLCFSVNSVIVVCFLFVLRTIFVEVVFDAIQSKCLGPRWDTKSNLNLGKRTKLYLIDESVVLFSGKWKENRCQCNDSFSI